MKTLYTLIFISLTHTLFAQKPANHEISDNHKNEFGIANSAVYIIKEKEFAYGLHFIISEVLKKPGSVLVSGMKEFSMNINTIR